MEMQETILLMLRQKGKAAWQNNCPELERKYSNIHNDPVEKFKEGILFSLPFHLLSQKTSLGRSFHKQYWILTKRIIQIRKAQDLENFLKM